MDGSESHVVLKFDCLVALGVHALRFMRMEFFL